MKITIVLSVVMLLALSLLSQTVPNLIDYQGRLTDENGNPITTEAPETIKFSIYDAETGGTLKWFDYMEVDVLNGLFHVQLGSVTSFPDTLFNGLNRWIGIKMSGDNEMTPRTRIASVPYALQSGSVSGNSLWTQSGSDIYYETGNVGIGTATPEVKLDVAGTVNITGFKMPTGASENYVLTSDINGVGTWQEITSSGGNTLDQAYDQGGPGVGKTITADAGSINIEGSDGLNVHGNINTNSVYNFEGNPVLKVSGSNTLVGLYAGANNDTGVHNTFIGDCAGEYNISGQENTFVGESAGENNNSAGNTFIGRLAGYSNIQGFNNTFIGLYSGRTNADGDRNTFIGANAGYDNSSGVENTYIGCQAGQGNSGNNNIFIGYQAGSLQSGSNKLLIANNN
ncbi:MAG: hypothetical protein K8S23_01190 [Candidatus Cloacimonetes bacterium]|nr:hypothetical protein [Candidatus Cloacimonadota bacterium]